MKDFVKDDLITMQDAIDRLGYSREWLQQQIREGNLPESGGKPEGWISRQELEKLARESLLRLTESSPVKSSQTSES